MSLLQFAGVDVLRPDPDVMSRISRWWDADAPELWTHPGYQTRGLDHLPIPAPPRSERPPLNKLIWPRGASRWGVIHLLMSGDQVAAAEAAVAAAGTSGGYGPATLTIKDGGAGTVTAQMFLIDVRPVWLKNAVGSAAAVRNTYVITLVDVRYFWWDRLLSYTFNVGNSWNTLLTNLVSAASGLTPTIPSIPGAYGVPSPQRWSAPNVPIVLLIDAVAKTLGMQFLNQRDGTCAFVQSTAAATADLNQFNLYAAQVVRGGRQAVADVIGNIPASVVVAFWGDVTTYQTVTLASLGLAAYGGLNGVSNSFGWLMADANAATVSPPRATTAAQMARDYYGWALALTDATFIGTQPVVLTGFEDRQEWEFAPGIPPIPAKGGVVAAGVNPPADMLPQKRLLTRIVPPDRHDQNHYGDRPPPRYTYNVRLTEQASNVWGGNIQVVNTGGAVVDGPPIGWGGTNKYVMYPVPGQSPNVGDYVTAVPDPFIANAWSFIDPNGSGGSQSGSGICFGCEILADLDTDICLTFSNVGEPGNGRCSCINDNQTYNLFWTTLIAGGAFVGGPFNTCCGCGIIVFQPIPNTLSATLTILDDNMSCQSGGGQYTYDMSFDRCCGKSVTFTGWGPQNCNGSGTGNCGNGFSVTVSCGGCSLYTCCCPACCGGAASTTFIVQVGGTWACAGYYIVNWDGPTNPCGWSGMCTIGSGSVGCGVTLYNVGGSVPPVWELNIGGATYQCVASAWDCQAGGTFGLVGTGPAGAPSTVTVSGTVNTGLTNPCGTNILVATVTDGNGNCSCLDGLQIILNPTDGPPLTNWAGSANSGVCPPGEMGPCVLGLDLLCDQNGNYQLQVVGSGVQISASLVMVCPAFMLVFTGVSYVLTSTGNCCDTGQTFTVTIVRQMT